MRLFLVMTVLAVVMLDIGAFAADKKIYVDTPGPCYETESVQDNKVLLRRSAKCNSSIKLAAASVDETVTSVEIYADGKLFKVQEIKDFNLDSVAGAIKSGQEMKDSMHVNRSEIEQKGRERAEKAYNAVMSAEYQNKVRAESERLQRTLFSRETGTIPNKEEPGRPEKKRLLAPYERIYVFVSSSMPLITLRGYVQAIDRLGDPNVFMVMRGMIGGISSIRPTTEFFGKIASQDPGCDFGDPAKATSCKLFAPNMIIDPLLFRRYSIDAVPAVVFVPSISVSNPGSEGIRENAAINDYFVRYGDASLSYHLGVFYRETKISSLAALKKKLEN